MIYGDTKVTADNLLTLSNSIAIQGYGSGTSGEIEKISAFVNHKKTV